MRDNPFSASDPRLFRACLLLLLMLALGFSVYGATPRPTRPWKKAQQQRQTDLLQAIATMVSAQKAKTSSSPSKSAKPAKPAKSVNAANAAKPQAKSRSLTVRTTAYTHNEKDHYRYGRKNAIGTQLKYGKIRSAAADWSFLPLGTKFRIDGDSSTYVIDDYGSALVGNQTVDIYKPSRRLMNRWGVRQVEIRIIEEGSRERSLKMLSERTRWRHVREMVSRLKTDIKKSSETRPLFAFGASSRRPGVPARER